MALKSRYTGSSTDSFTVLPYFLYSLSIIFMLGGVGFAMVAINSDDNDKDDEGKGNAANMTTNQPAPLSHKAKEAIARPDNPPEATRTLSQSSYQVSDG